MSELQNIVIVGASCAGHALANTLVPDMPATHRILLIDAQSFSYFPIASLRAAVVPGWENKMTGPLNTEAVFGKNPPHQVIAPNRVVELKKDSVVLEKEFEGKTEVPFFKCILAFGTSQPYPMRGNPADSLDDVRATLKRMQADVAKAKKVVVIGGGPVGLEYAGEVRARFPDTAITILHSLARPLNPTDPSKAAKSNTEGEPHAWQAPYSNPKLSSSLESYLKQLKIEFIGNAKIDIPSLSSAAQGEGIWNGTPGPQDSVKKVILPDGKTVEGDYFFVGIGNKSNAGFVEQADSGAVVKGLVRVDQYLKVQSSSLDSPLTSNYYAIGDCCTTPGWKTLQGATADVGGVAPNVIADIKGRPLKVYKRGTVHGMVIPLGPQRGVGYMTAPFLCDITLPEFGVKKAKAEKLFADQFYADRFKGSVKVGVNAA